MRRLACLFTILSTALILPGHAALTLNTAEVDGTAGGNGTTVAAAQNLISTYGTLSSTDFVPFQSDSYTILNDGALNTGTAVTGSGDPWTLTVTLNTTTNTSGYTITGLDAFTGWTNDYADQSYTVSYSTVSDPTDFISLGSYTAVNTNPNAPGSATANLSPTTLETLLTPAAGQSFIATNVAALQYTFSQAPAPTGQYGDVGHIEAYTELEAFGSADAVPEPSTYALIGLGLGGLVLVARMRGLRA